MTICNPLTGKAFEEIKGKVEDNVKFLSEQLRARAKDKATYIEDEIVGLAAKSRVDVKKLKNSIGDFSVKGLEEIIKKSAEQLGDKFDKITNDPSGVAKAFGEKSWAEVVKLVKQVTDTTINSSNKGERLLSNEFMKNRQASQNAINAIASEAFDRKTPLGKILHSRFSIGRILGGKGVKQSEANMNFLFYLTKKIMKGDGYFKTADIAAINAAKLTKDSPIVKDYLNNHSNKYKRSEIESLLFDKDGKVKVDPDAFAAYKQASTILERAGRLMSSLTEDGGPLFRYASELNTDDLIRGYVPSARKGRYIAINEKQKMAIGFDSIHAARTQAMKMKWKKEDTQIIDRFKRTEDENPDFAFFKYAKELKDYGGWVADDMLGAIFGPAGYLNTMGRVINKGLNVSSYRNLMSTYLREMKAKNPNKSLKDIKEVRKQYKMLKEFHDYMNTADYNKLNSVIDTTRSLMFIKYVVGNLATYYGNTYQFLGLAPMLQSRHFGVNPQKAAAKNFKAFTELFSFVMRGKKPKISDDEAKFIEELDKMGAFGNTKAEEFFGQYGALSDITNVLGKDFERWDKISRMATALSSYRMIKNSKIDVHEKHVKDLVMKMVLEANFSYGKENTPEFFRKKGNLAKVMRFTNMFMNYTRGLNSFFKRQNDEFRTKKIDGNQYANELYHAVGSAVVLGGYKAIPYLMLTGGLVGSLFGNEDFDKDIDEVLLKDNDGAIASVLARLMYGGVPALANVDVGYKLSLPSTPTLVAWNPLSPNLPAYQYMRKVGQSINAFGNLEIGDGIKNMAVPEVWLRSAMYSARAAEGKLSKQYEDPVTGNRVTVQHDAYEKILRIVGFNAVSNHRAYREKEFIKQTRKILKDHLKNYDALENDEKRELVQQLYQFYTDEEVEKLLQKYDVNKKKG